MRVVAALLGAALVLAPVRADAARHERPAGVRTVTVVDASRAVPANGSFPGAPTRELVTRIYYPARAPRAGAADTDDVTADAPVANGRFPLVVFGHGSGGTGRTHERLLAAWARAGFVVAAPSFPLSKGDAPGGATNADRARQAGDLSFLITAAAQLAWLRGHVDEGRVAVAGHSLGAYSALQAGYGACCADPRVDAVISLAGLGYGVPDGVAADEAPPPLLLVHGRRDPEVPYELSRRAYTDSSARRLLVTLHGQDPVAAHVVPYVGGGGARATATTAITLDFLAWQLADDRGAHRRLLRDATRPGIASVEEAVARHRG